jgi:hypothetical protein
MTYIIALHPTRGPAQRRHDIPSQVVTAVLAGVIGAQDVKERGRAFDDDRPGVLGIAILNLDPEVP